MLPWPSWRQANQLISHQASPQDAGLASHARHHSEPGPVLREPGARRHGEYDLLYCLEPSTRSVDGVLAATFMQ